MEMNANYKEKRPEDLRWYDAIPLTGFFTYFARGGDALFNGEDLSVNEYLLKSGALLTETLLTPAVLEIGKTLLSKL